MTGATEYVELVNSDGYVVRVTRDAVKSALARGWRRASQVAFVRDRAGLLIVCDAHREAAMWIGEHS